MSLAIFNDPFFDFERVLDTSINRGVGRNVASPPKRSADDYISRTLGLTTHAFDVVELKDKFELIADAPGMTPEDIKIELHDNMIVVSGSHKEAKYVEEPPVMAAGGGGKPTSNGTTANGGAAGPAAGHARVWRSERRSYQFSRTFALPENTNADGIVAGLDKGILTVSIPKLPETPKPQPRRIAVTATMA